VLGIVGLLAVTIAFGAGYRLASRTSLKARVASASGVPPTDFAIPLPEGSTRITIFDPQLDNAELTTFTVERQANSFKSIPELERTIAPRNHPSLDDVAFFKHELSGVIKVTDSQWRRENKFRNWLFSSRYKMSMPGLATRMPRETYLEMRQGKPVLCGNLAEIYVPVCESAGLIAPSVGLRLMVRDGTVGTNTQGGAGSWS